MSRVRAPGRSAAATLQVPLADDLRRGSAASPLKQVVWTQSSQSSDVQPSGGLPPVLARAAARVSAIPKSRAITLGVLG